MTLNHHFNRSGPAVTSNKTLTAADSGVVQVVKADGINFTLPASAVGLTFTFRNDSRLDGDYGFTVTPASGDGVTGNGFTAAINKGVVSTKTTSRAHDEFTLVGAGGTGAGAWVFSSVQGTVTRTP